MLQPGPVEALIGGGGGVDIHIFAFCPTNFFLNQLSLQLISKEIRRGEREYMNMLPPINALVTALASTGIQVQSSSIVFAYAVDTIWIFI